MKPFGARQTTTITLIVLMASMTPVSTASAATMTPVGAAAPSIAHDADISIARSPASVAAIESFIESDAPKTITIDAVRNEITSVADQLPSTERGMSTTCSGGQLCWYGVAVPYSNNGYSSAGTYTGRWNGRGTVKANSSRACSSWGRSPSQPS